MKWKKYLAGTIAAVVTAVTIVPGGVGAENAQAAAVEASAEEAVEKAVVEEAEEEAGAEAVVEEAVEEESVEAAANAEESVEAVAEEAIDTEESVEAVEETADAEVSVQAMDIDGAGYTASTAAELQSRINSATGGNMEDPVSIKITAGFEVNTTITIPSGKFVKIYGEAAEGTSAFPVLNNTNTSEGARSVFHVANGGSLVLENITLTATGLSGVFVSEGGEFYMESGAVIQKGNAFVAIKNDNSGELDCYYGGGVTNYGTFVMNGGIITDCRNATSGIGQIKGIDANGKEYVKETVYHCTYGGGVYNAGTFTMNGGEITGNQIIAHGGSQNCNGYGGGAANGETGTFIMNDGVISGNSGELGAGVYNAGSMELAGGTITGNTGTTNLTPSSGTHISTGGGIYNDGTISFTGGSITGNSVAKGGGVYTAGKFTMNGEAAEISSNTANFSRAGRGFSCGGGVYVAAGEFGLDAGKISLNIANNGASVSSSNNSWDRDTVYTGYGVIGNGGGVFVANGGAEFKMTGGEISGNKAMGNSTTEDIARQGGGVYVQGGKSDDASDRKAVPGKFVMTGGTITKNTARSGGDGIYIGNYDYFITTILDAGTGYRPTVIYQFRGAAGFELGGTASVTANVNEDICLSDGVQMQIIEPLQTTEKMKISSGDKSENAVLAVYSNADNYRETDAELFLPGINDIRTVAYDPGQHAFILRKRKLDDTYTVKLSFESAVFNGKAQEPAVVSVTGPDGTVLPENEYTVSYEKNTDAGTEAVVIVSGAEDGNYSGSIRKKFVITPKNISSSGSRITAADNDLTRGTYSAEYTGKEIKPSVSLIVLKDQETGAQLLRNKDYVVSFSDNIEAGTGKVIVTGFGNYTGTITYPFSIKKKEISQMTVSNIADQKYTGTAITPALTIKDGSKVLAKGTDYTVSYEKNTDAGTAAVIITGKGFYSGTKRVTFRITPKSISGASVKTIANQTYTGKAIKPAPAVKFGNITLKKGKDYTLSYKNNTKTGKATVTITGTGNYTGNRTMTFRIIPKKAALKTVASTKKKQLTVKWKKDAQASGYQIMVARNAKFTSGKKTKTVKKNTQLSATFTGLKRGKKYYVAVRSYKTIDGKKVYGAWSSYKTKKVK